jgi:hypothetical protein
VHERDAELTELQHLLNRSLDTAGVHLRSIFGDEHRLDAAGLVATLDGVVEMHLAVVTSNGAPLVAPVDAVLFRGKLWFGIPDRAVRARLIHRDPRVSASYNMGSFAFIVHGTAHAVDESSGLWKEYESVLRDLYVAEYGPGWVDWWEQLRRQPRGSSFTGYIEPRVMFAKR